MICYQLRTTKRCCAKYPLVIRHQLKLCRTIEVNKKKKWLRATYDTCFIDAILLKFYNCVDLIQMEKGIDKLKCYLLFVYLCIYWKEDTLTFPVFKHTSTCTNTFNCLILIGNKHINFTAENSRELYNMCLLFLANYWLQILLLIID